MAVNELPVQRLENLSPVQQNLIPELRSNVAESQLLSELIKELNSNLENSEIPSTEVIEELEAQIRPVKPLQTLKPQLLSQSPFKKLQAESLSSLTIQSTHTLS